MKTSTLAAMLVSCLGLGCGAAAKPPQERVDRLARGINIPHWFWLPENATPEGYSSYFSAEEATQLARWKFTHVRLPFDPEYLWDRAGGALREANLKAYRKGIELLLAADLAVVVDAHPLADSWAHRIEDEAAVASYEAMWQALASALADTDPERVFFEVMNEPHDISKRDGWSNAQARYVKTIRAAAPRHTIICTGDEWGSIEGLRWTRPVEDDNVVYSFHFYDPHNFTHQGATWGFEPWRHMKNIPFPATRADLEAAAAELDNTAAEALVWSADRDPWQPHGINEQFDTARAWATEKGVDIYCGEFGVLRAVAPADSRARWLHDVTSSLGERGIGWCMWDYSGGLALRPGPPGDRGLDRDALDAIRPAHRIAPSQEPE